MYDPLFAAAVPLVQDYATQIWDGRIKPRLAGSCAQAQGSASTSQYETVVAWISWTVGCGDHELAKDWLVLLRRGLRYAATLTNSSTCCRHHRDVCGGIG